MQGLIGWRLCAGGQCVGQTSRARRVHTQTPLLHRLGLAALPPFAPPYSSTNKGDPPLAALRRPPPFLCCSLPADQRPAPDAACRGVLAETALTGRQRYEWRLLLPLLHSLVDAVLADYARQQEEEEQVRGPGAAVPAVGRGGGSRPKFEGLGIAESRLQLLE